MSTSDPSSQTTEPYPGMPRDGHVRVQVMAERNVPVKVEIWVPDTNGFWSWRWFPLDELAKGIELPVIALPKFRDPT